MEVLLIAFLLLLTLDEVPGTSNPSWRSARAMLKAQKRREKFDQRNLLLQRHANDREECIRRQAVMRQYDLYIKAHEKYREANQEWMKSLPGTPERERWSTIERKLMEVCDQLRIPDKDLCIVQPAPESKTSWKSEVVADKSGEFRGNGLRFATSVEAGAHVLDLTLRKTAVHNGRIVECNEPVNAKWTENGVVASAGSTPRVGLRSGRRGVHSQAIAGGGGVTHRGQAVIVAQPHAAHH
jgi:hypothetical protein